MAKSMDGWPATFTAAPLQSDDEAAKKLFGTLLGQGIEPFKAASEVIKDTGQALWASQNWPDDPIVVEARKNAEGVHSSQAVLDKTQLAARALAIADTTGYEAQDRIKALELYAKIMGLIEKPVPSNVINNNNLRFINLKFVKPDESLKEQSKVIDQTPIAPEETSRVKLKLVKSA